MSEPQLLRVSRRELLRSWLAYYDAKGTAKAGVAIEENLTRLRMRMMHRGHSSLPGGLETLWGMAYGIHSYCKWVYRRRLEGT